jgi:hypothetical protein
MLPEHYGTVQIPIVRKGNLTYGSFQEQLDKVSNILTGYEKNVEQAEQTQAQYQLLANVALVVFLLGGSYIGYKFYQELKK